MQSTSRDLGSGVRNGSFYQVRSQSLPVWLGSSFKGGLEERFQACFLAGGLIVIVSLTSNLLKGVSPPDCGLLAVNVAKRVIFGGCEKIHSKSGWRSTFAELTIKLWRKLSLRSRHRCHRSRDGPLGPLQSVFGRIATNSENSKL